MAKERDFLDYAQLGLIAGQAANLSQMSAELTALRHSIETQLKNGQRQGKARQMILLSEELLARWEHDPNGTETPLKRQFALAYETEQILQKAGVLPPEDIESWDDKDRASNLEKRIDTFRNRLLREMPEFDRREAELCVKYMEEEKDLSDYIRHKTARRLERGVLIPPGYQIDAKALAEKFGPKTVRELRSAYKERRDFVRSILGPHYLAFQNGGKAKKARAGTESQNRLPTSLTHKRTLTVTDRIARMVVTAIVITVMGTIGVLVIVALFG